jgi:hypothetical protein
MKTQEIREWGYNGQGCPETLQTGRVEYTGG